MPDSANGPYRTAANILKKSHHTVVFTGAGISTPSGIPDFRSPDTGLWQKSDPMLVASATAFKYHPDRFYGWLQPLLLASSLAQPNPAHHAIAALENAGIVKSVITQNIDSLHQTAGSKNVIELHGTMNSFHCSGCGRPSNDSQAVTDEIIAGLIPYCNSCGSILKPDIILYEEALPMQAWDAASYEADLADVMIVAGSSLEVSPASSIPYQAYQHGCHIIITNLSPTYMDSLADVVIAEDVANSIPKLFELINED